MPQISIIVPVFNSEASLARCLVSLIGQTFADIEIICIDDGSTDATPQLLQRFAGQDTRITVITQVNGGAAAARNSGLDRVKSPYVMFCDSDDYYDLRYCERMLEAIQQQAVDVVMCQTQVVMESTEQRTVKNSYFNLRLYGKYLLSDELVAECNTVIWNKIWKQELIQRAQICFPEGHEHEDDAFWFMYALEAKTIYFLTERYYHHMIRSGSVMDRITRKCPRNKFDRVTIARIVDKFAHQQGYAHTFAQRLTQYYRVECEGLQLELFDADERLRLVNDLNGASPEGELFFFFGKRGLTCVLKRDINQWVFPRKIAAFFISCFTVGLMRRAMRRKRRYLTDVLIAKRILRA